MLASQNSPHAHCVALRMMRRFFWGWRAYTVVAKTSKLQPVLGGLRLRIETALSRLNGSKEELVFGAARLREIKERVSEEEKER